MKRTSDTGNLSEVDHSSEEEPEVQTSNLENSNPQKTWSTGVNRFDQYSTGDNSLLRLREGNFRSTVRSNLETVVGSESDLLSNSDVFEEDANDDETSQASGTEYQEYVEQPGNQIEVIMDENAYNTRKNALQDEVDTISESIEDCTIEDVFSHNYNEILTELNSITGSVKT